MTVGSLNGAGSASLTAAEDAVITNSSSSPAILEVGGNGNTSTFGGRIIDGVGTVELYVINCHQGFTLTSTANEYSGGTILNDGDLILGNGTTDGMVQGNIQLTDEDSVVSTSSPARPRKTAGQFTRPPEALSRDWTATLPSRAAGRLNSTPRNRGFTTTARRFPAALWRWKTARRFPRMAGSPSAARKNGDSCTAFSMNIPQ